jgi:hypothetical protein
MYMLWAVHTCFLSFNSYFNDAVSDADVTDIQTSQCQLLWIEGVA